MSLNTSPFTFYCSIASDNTALPFSPSTQISNFWLFWFIKITAGTQSKHTVATARDRLYSNHNYDSDNHSWNCVIYVHVYILLTQLSFHRPSPLNIITILCLGWEQIDYMRAHHQYFLIIITIFVLIIEVNKNGDFIQFLKCLFFSLAMLQSPQMTSHKPKFIFLFYNMMIALLFYMYTNTDTRARLAWISLAFCRLHYF